MFGAQSSQVPDVMVHGIEHTPTILLKPIQVSPRGFKRQIETVLGALTQLGMRATVFAKLPKGSSWAVDLQQYTQALHPHPEVFIWVREVADGFDWGQPVLIPPTHPMQGEYFVLAIAEEIGVLIWGHREDTAVGATAATAAAANSDEPETLPMVKYQVTFQKSLIQNFVNGLRDSVQGSWAAYPEQAFLESWVNEWADRCCVPPHCHPALIDAIVQRSGIDQERLQRQARAFRRQAMTASNLSTQNESLMKTIQGRDDFLKTVGQELKTPLSTIKTALPLLSSSTLKPPQRQRYLDMISHECDRQINLIKGVLELLQIERTMMTAQPEPVNLFDILPGVVSTYQPLAQEKGIRLAYTVPNTLPVICCPENWVRQIVIQLLSNSIRFTESGGEVWVTVQPTEEDMLAINIRDTGLGIPQHELPHIFDHFYRGKQPSPDEEGVGLGLAIVRQLLLYCDGQISVESQPEVGTHFTVKLPLHHAE